MTTTHDSTQHWLTGLAAAALGLVVIGVLVVRSSTKRREGGEHVREFLRSGRNEKDGEEGARGESIEWEEAAEMSAVTQPDLTEVGEHIASVLAAAEAAASKLRIDAEQAARTAIEEAQQTAEELRRRAKDEGQTTRASAQRIMDEAEAASKDLRSDADRYAGNRRREADEQAAQIVVEAERNAAVIADTARERHREVLTNIATSEARLRDLAKSLRGVAFALDTVVGDASAEDGATDESSGETLEQSLRPRAASRQSEGVAHQ